MKRILLVITLVATLSSFGGVFATWQYSGAPMQSVSQDLSVSISEFNYKAEEILPGGSGNTGPVEIGGDHFTVVKLIVDEAGNGYALNSSGSLIHSLLNQRDDIHSSQKVQGGNLKFILDPKNNTHKLYYAIEKSSANLYYIYTYNVDDLSTVSGTNTELAVYKTTVSKTNGTWVIGDSHLGYAKSVSISSLGLSNMSQTLNYVIDVYSWHL